MVLELIVNNEELLRQKCKNVSVKEGRKIAKEMTNFLKQYNKNHSVKGIGLAAPQVGIFKKVCIFLIRNNLFLVNPIITRHSIEKIEQDEECLSFPNQKIRTLRNRWVEVSADNLNKPILFGPKDFTLSGDNEGNILESVVAQHETDHVFQKLFFDRAVSPKSS